MAEETPPAAATVPVDEVVLLDEGLWVEAASRRRQPIARAPQAVEIIDDEELARSPAVSIPDHFRYISGMDVAQNRHGQFDVGLRGFNGISSPRTLALVDGRDIASRELGTVFWIGPIHRSDIRRIEVVKGPASVAYGANAFGGVIAVLPRDVGDRWELHTFQALGDHGHTEVDATAMGPLPYARRWHLKVSAGSSTRDDLPGIVGTPPPSGPVPRARFTGEDDLSADRYHVVVGYRPAPEWAIEADWRRFDLHLWEMIEDLSPGSNFVRQTEDAFGLRLTSPYGHIEHVHTVADGFYSNSIAVFDPMEAFRNTQAGFDNDSDRTTGQFDIDLGSHHLTLGGSYEEWRSRSNLWAADGSYDDEDSWEQVVVRNTAAYGEHQWDIDGRWSTAAGLRVDDHNLVGTNVSPRAAINRRFGVDHYARLSFSSGYRLPTAIESYIEEFFFTVDEDIEAETITSVDLTLSSRPIADLRIDAGVFFNRANDLLFFRPLPEDQMRDAWFDALLGGDPEAVPGPFFELRNLDNPNTGYGIELTTRYQLTEAFEFWTNATWQRYRFEDRIHYQSDGFIDPLSGQRVFAFDEKLDRDINAPPEWKGSVGAAWSRDGFRATLVFRAVGGREVFSFSDSSFQKRGDVATQHIDSYAEIDLGLSWHGRFGGGTVGTARLSVMNLLGHEHYETYQPESRILALDDEIQYASEIGRRVLASLDLHF